MKKTVLLACLALGLPFLAQGQFNYGHKYWEVGGMLGVSNYAGELTNSIVDFKHMHLGGGLFVRYNSNKYLTFRLHGNYGNISGDDRNSRDTRNQLRNLHFRSSILEIGGAVEINLMGYHTRGHERLFSPYIFVGLAGFHFDPKARHFDPSRDGEWVRLQPFNTEGQGDPSLPNRNPYKTTQVAIPLGLGMKFAINSNINLGFEVGFRKTFTDYLDDVGNTYAFDPVSGESRYNEGAYRDGFFGNMSERQLMADRTYEYLVNRNGGTFGPDFPSEAEYQQAVAARGGPLVRGDKLQDWYIFSGLTISYNFLDEGLVKSRKRRKRKAGCASSQF